MLSLFTRKELLITFDSKQLGNVRDALAAHGIPYTVKVTNRQGAAAVGSLRGRVGSYGMNPDAAYEYKIYVHRNDYEHAMGLIR